MCESGAGEHGCRRGGPGAGNRDHSREPARGVDRRLAGIALLRSAVLLRLQPEGRREMIGTAARLLGRLGVPAAVALTLCAAPAGHGAGPGAELTLSMKASADV